jgi:hypothetical protein
MPKSIKDRYDEAGNVGKVGSSSVPTRPLKGTYLVPVYDVDNSKGRVSKLDDLLADSDTAFKIMAHSGAYTIVEGTAKYDSAGNLLSASVVWADGSPGGIVRSTTGTTTSTVYRISKPGTTTRYLAADKSVDASGNTRGETWSETGFIAVTQSLLPFCFVFGEIASPPPDNTGIQTLEVTGVGLTGDVSVEALGSFQVSLDDLTYGEKVAVSPDSPTPVYVKMTETDQGEYTGLLLFSAAGAKTVSIPVSGAIGDGTSDYPYPIANASMLLGLVSFVAAEYKQYCDIDLDGQSWTPWGGFANEFSGVYDGGGYRILNLVAAANGESGFFGIAAGATISNMNIVGASVTSTLGGPAGIMGGQLNSCTIENCHVSGTVSGGTGGFAGSVQGGTVTGCSSDATIIITNDGVQIGGFIGYLYGTAVTECWSRGTMEIGAGTAMTTGGFIGESYESSTILDCYTEVAPAEGTVGGAGFIGVISGEVTTVTNCYASVKTPTGGVPAGFCTYLEGGSTITHCYWDNTKNPGLDDPDASGVGGSTTKELLAETTFTGWDFTDVWEIHEGQGMPHLKREG